MCRRGTFKMWRLGYNEIDNYLPLKAALELLR